MFQGEALEKALERSKTHANEVDCVFAGDLLNQCIGSSFGLMKFVILGRCFGILKITFKGLSCRRSHCRPHVIGVAYTEVNYSADCRPCNADSFFKAFQNTASRTCNRPLCGWSANSAVFKRKTVLPFRRCKV